MRSGPNRNPPAERSSTEPKTLGASGRGTHIHSTLPLGATRHDVSQSERNPYSAMGGKGLPPLRRTGECATRSPCTKTDCVTPSPPHEQHHEYRRDCEA
ncbi:hypothetical protein FAGKG844_190083 [Frankia sp. AgKG'84/4]